jgi:hypothetical protein
MSYLLPLFLINESILIFRKQKLENFHRDQRDLNRWYRNQKIVRERHSQDFLTFAGRFQIHLNSLEKSKK